MSVSHVWLNRHHGISMGHPNVGTVVRSHEDGGSYFYSRQTAATMSYSIRLGRDVSLRFAAIARGMGYYNTARSWINTARKMRGADPV